MERNTHMHYQNLLEYWLTNNIGKTKYIETGHVRGRPMVENSNVTIRLGYNFINKNENLRLYRFYIDVAKFFSPGSRFNVGNVLLFSSNTFFLFPDSKNLNIETNKAITLPVVLYDREILYVTLL